MSRVSSRNNNKTVLKLCVKHHHKHNQSNEIRKQERKQTHQDGNPVRPNMTYYEGRSALQFIKMKVIQIG